MSEIVRLDPQNLHALAHPLRVRLLNLLRAEGPSTATRLAERLGQSSGLTSYHLRKLAAHGFVEEDPRPGRERWWRSVHAETTLDADSGRAEPEVTEGYLRAVAAADFARLDAFLGELALVPREWDDGFTMSTHAVRLNPAEAKELLEAVEALVRRYPTDDPENRPDDGRERVVVQYQVLPELRALRGSK